MFRKDDGKRTHLFILGASKDVLQITTKKGNTFLAKVTQHGTYDLHIYEAINFELEYIIDDNYTQISPFIQLITSHIREANPYDEPIQDKQGNYLDTVVFCSDKVKLLKELDNPYFIEPKVKKLKQKKLRAEIVTPQYGLGYYMKQAIEEGFLDCFESLIAQGMSMYTTISAYSQLDWATKHSRTRIVESLFEKGYKIQNPKEEVEVLRSATKTGNAKLLEVLFKNGINPNTSIAYSDSSVSYSLTELLKKDLCDCVELCLRYGANVQLDAWSFFKSACDGLSVRGVELLLDAGLDINLLSSDGEPLLYTAIHTYKCDEIVQLLCERGANVNFQLADGSTMLLHALLEFHKKDMTLLQFGANPTVGTLYGRNALEWAIDRKNQAVIDKITAFQL